MRDQVIANNHSQRSSHGAELFKRDIGSVARLDNADQLAAEREEVVQLLLGGLWGETSDVDGVTWGDGGHCEVCELC